MTEDYKRQTNDLFYNVVHNNKNVSDASLNDLLAMQSGLEQFIKEKKQKDFDEKVKAIKDAVKALKREYPCTSAYVVLNATYEEGEDFDMIDYIENAVFEP